MTLDHWLKRSGVSKHDLHFEAKVSMPAIERALGGHASRASAEKIAAAVYRRTGNRVPVTSMCRTVARKTRAAS
jgi:hypothetical protein